MPRGAAIGSAFWCAYVGALHAYTTQIARVRGGCMRALCPWWLRCRFLQALYERGCLRIITVDILWEMENNPPIPGWRGGREAEGGGLLNRYTSNIVSRVRIPLSPLRGAA